MLKNSFGSLVDIYFHMSRLDIALDRYEELAHEQPDFENFKTVLMSYKSLFSAAQGCNEPAKSAAMEAIEKQILRGVDLIDSEKQKREVLLDLRFTGEDDKGAPQTLLNKELTERYLTSVQEEQSLNSQEWVELNKLVQSF